MVTGLPNKYHPIVQSFLQMTNKQVHYAGCKKQYENIIMDMIAWNLLLNPSFYSVIIKKNLS